jgi:arylsulfatase
MLVERKGPSDDGVLLAYGNLYFGWVLYVKDERLVYEFSNMPFGASFVSDQKIPVGRCELRYEQEMRRRPFDGVGRMFIGEAKVAQFELPTFAFGVAYQGLEVGRNGATPVSRSYAAPFAFRGRLIECILDYDVSPYNDSEMQRILARTRLQI